MSLLVSEYERVSEERVKLTLNILLVSIECVGEREGGRKGGREGGGGRESKREGGERGRES